MDNFWAVLVGMTTITYSCRYFFFSKTITIELNKKVRKLLSFTAPSVLTAMWVPIVFMGHQSTNYEIIESPFLIAGLVTIVLSLKVKHTLVVVILGMTVFAILKMF